MGGGTLGPTSPFRSPSLSLSPWPDSLLPPFPLPGDGAGLGASLELPDGLFLSGLLVALAAPRPRPTAFPPTVFSELLPRMPRPRPAPAAVSSFLFFFCLPSPSSSAASSSLALFSPPGPPPLPGLALALLLVGVDSLLVLNSYTSSSLVAASSPDMLAGLAGALIFTLRIISLNSPLLA